MCHCSPLQDARLIERGVDRRTVGISQREISLSVRSVRRMRQDSVNPFVRYPASIIGVADAPAERIRSRSRLEAVLFSDFINFMGSGMPAEKFG